jgi:phage tail-like protein
MELYNWRKLVEQGKMSDARRNIAIIVLDEEGNAKSRWEFVEAWPTKYDAPDLNATGNEIAIENLEIAHEGMNRIS